MIGAGHSSGYQCETAFIQIQLPAKEVESCSKREEGGREGGRAGEGGVRERRKKRRKEGREGEREGGGERESD